MYTALRQPTGSRGLRSPLSRSTSRGITPLHAQQQGLATAESTDIQHPPSLRQAHSRTCATRRGKGSFPHACNIGSQKHSRCPPNTDPNCNPEHRKLLVERGHPAAAA
eukprot:7379603-Prymnesium_polylepis.1